MVNLASQPSLDWWHEIIFENKPTFKNYKIGINKKNLWDLKAWWHEIICKFKPTFKIDTIEIKLEYIFNWLKFDNMQ